MTAVVTYAQLWRASPPRWSAAAAAWRSVATLSAERSAELGAHASALDRFWSGPAARSARACLSRLAARLDATRPGWWSVDQALSRYAVELVRAKAMLAGAVEDAQRAGLTVDADGVVRPGPGPLDAARDRAVPDAAARIGAALTVAADADRQTARQLADLAAAAGAGWPMSPPRDRPPGDAEPATVRRWWTGLTDEQRRWLVVHEPALVGRLDGVPAAARDQANRLRLDARRTELVAAHAAAVRAGHGRSAAPLADLLHSLDGLATRLAADTSPRGYLLAFDPRGDGRAVVALGDPDTADNVLTYVPGMTAALADMDGELDRAARVAAAAHAVGPTERTAAVLWLDYDAPDFVDEAAGVRQAREAGPALHRFQEGLLATQVGPPAHHTVLGHSYGSLVVGATAARYGLAADSVVFVGSPGVGVDSAASLGMPAGQVWASTSQSDPIQYAARAPASMAVHLALTPGVPALGVAAMLAGPGHELWFGRNPVDPSFGARVFTSQPDAGHVDYWEPGRPALDALARITLGGTHQAAVR